MIMRTQNGISAVVYDMYVRALCWPDMAWQAPTPDSHHSLLLKQQKFVFWGHSFLRLGKVLQREKFLPNDSKFKD